MDTIRAKHVNPFLISTVHVFRQVCQKDPLVEAPRLAHKADEEDTVVISLGLIGQLVGKVQLVFEKEAACKVVSAMMMGMEINDVKDAMTQSALCELGNMIMGNAATLLYGDNVGIDITPPTLMVGDSEETVGLTKVVEVPMSYENTQFSIRFLIKTEQ